jgi:hypothetical protein
MNEEQLKNIRYFNFMNRQLEQTFNESDIVLARSGYTTMDLVRLGKKPFYPNSRPIWTIILGKKITRRGLAPYAEQDDFKIDYFK